MRYPWAKAVLHGWRQGGRRMRRETTPPRGGSRNLVTVLAAWIAVSLVAVPVDAQQQQSFEEVNDIVLGHIKFCAEDLIPVAFPSDTGTFSAPPTQVAFFWACLYYGGWPSVDVADARLDRQLRVVQSILDSQNSYLSNLTAVSRDPATDPEWALIDDDVLRFVSCSGWVLISVVALGSMSEEAQAQASMPTVDALCGETPDVLSLRLGVGEMLEEQSLFQFFQRRRR